MCVCEGYRPTSTESRERVRERAHTCGTCIISNLSAIFEKRNRENKNIHQLDRKDVQMFFFFFAFNLNSSSYSVRKLTRSASGTSPSKLKAKIHGCLQYIHLIRTAIYGFRI